MLWHKVQGAGGKPRLWSNPNLGTATYDNVSFDPSVSTLADIFFRPDGFTFYTAENLNTLKEWTLSTAWDFSTASAGDTASISGIQSVFFKSDGTRVFWVNNTLDTVNQADLSTAWDITTIGSPTTGAPAVGTVVRGIRFSVDGTKMYSADRQNHQIEQFNLSTAWDISSSSASTTPDEVLVVSPQAFNPYMHSFNPDGTKLWVTSISSIDLVEFDLATAWDVSTGTYSGSNLSVSSQDSVPLGGTFKSDGSKLYIAGNTNDKIFQYSTA